MSIPYFARLLCLSLAAFFLAHLVLTAIVSAIAARVIERLTRISARDGARLLSRSGSRPPCSPAHWSPESALRVIFWLEPDPRRKKSA